MKTDLTPVPPESGTNKLMIRCDHTGGFFSVRSCEAKTTYGEAVKRKWTHDGSGRHFCELHSENSVPLGEEAEHKQLIEFNPVDADFFNPFKEKPFYLWVKANYGKYGKFHEALIAYIKETQGIEFKKEAMRFHSEFLMVVKWTYQQVNWDKPCRT